MSSFASTGWTYVQGKVGYATSDTGPNGTGAFSIFDLSGSAPVLLGQINNDARLAFAEGVQVCGRWAFVACMTNSVILVIDCGTLSAPIIVGALTDATHLYQCEALLMCGNYLLVSCDHQTSGLSNFTVVGITYSATPGTAPTLAVVGTLANASLYGAVYIDVQGKIAFVTCRNTMAGYGVVAAIDFLTNPAAPSLLGTFGTSSGPFTGGGLGSYITGIDVWGQFAFVAASGVGGVVVINVANPGAMTQVGATFLNASLAAISNVHLAGDLLYCSSYTPGLGITVLAVSPVGALSFVSNTPAISSTFMSDHMDLDGDNDFQADTSAGGGVALIALGGIRIPSLHVGRLYADDVHIGKDLRLARNLLVGGAISPAGGGAGGGIGLSGAVIVPNGATTVGSVFVSVSLNCVYQAGPLGGILTIVVNLNGGTVAVNVGATSSLGTSLIPACAGSGLFLLSFPSQPNQWWEIVATGSPSVVSAWQAYPLSSSSSSYAGVTAITDYTSTVTPNSYQGIGAKPTTLTLTVTVVAGGSVQILANATVPFSPGIIIGGQTNTSGATQSWTWTWTMPPNWYWRVNLTGAGSGINQITGQY